MLPTVTIASSRLVSTFQMELLVGSVIVIAAIALMAMTRLRHHHHHHRHR